MTYSNVYEYYIEQEVLPTYGGFRSRKELEAYEKQRREIFTDKLFLPKSLFKDARLIEFGPDAGENSLVFGLWGARCTLVEPNIKAHQVIRQYFRQFGLSDKLVRLDHSDMEAFSRRAASEENFDVIDAEGFMNTVRPRSLWIELFGRLLNSDGFVILFDTEAFGSFMELMLKVIHARVREVTGMKSLEVARKLFTTKWNSIPHKRSMESWVMDVLENPFVRLRYFFEPQSLCKEMYEGGFYLYSSWPPYKDGLHVRWFKKALTAEEQLAMQSEFIARSRLSHIFGRKHFLLNADTSVEKTLSGLLNLCDRMIDRFDTEGAMQCIDHLSAVAKLVSSDAVVADAQDKVHTLQLIQSLQSILHLLVRGEVSDLIVLCNSDEAFIRTWGLVSHFAIFRKLGTTEQAIA